MVNSYLIIPEKGPNVKSYGKKFSDFPDRIAVVDQIVEHLRRRMTSFEQFEQCRSFFREMINILRQMNYSEFKGGKFMEYQQQLTKLLS